MFNSTNNTPFTMPVMPATGGYGNDGAFNDGGWLWIIVVFALLFGWGNNGFGGFGGNGGGTVQYPLMKRNCRQVVASGLRTRTRYKTVVETTDNSGFFRMIGEPCCTPDNRLSAINGEAADGGE